MAKRQTSEGAGRNGTSMGLLALIAGFFAQEWVKSLLIAGVIALSIRWICAEPFRIPSGSMEPTLHGDEAMFKGDRVFVDKLAYGTRFPFNRMRMPFTQKWIDYADRRIWNNEAPKRWDIVVFKTVEDNAMHSTLVKRIVGMPGERIHIEGGKVYANGKALELPPSMPPIEYTSPLEGTYGIRTEDRYSVVPEGCYLLLGDNSRHSRDGRYFGWVPNEHLLGRVSCIWWPYARWRDFTGFSHRWPWRVVTWLVAALCLARLLFMRSWHLRRAGEGDSEIIEHYLINRWAFGLPVPFTWLRAASWGMPERGQLVLYRRTKPEKGEPHLLLGRIAGLPGERVYLDGGRLTVNGEVPSCPALASATYASGEGVGPYARSKGREYAQVPEDGYFILTESPLPEEHFDSRTFGWISRGELVGTAKVVWWPITRWRRVR